MARDLVALVPSTFVFSQWFFHPFASIADEAPAVWTVGPKHDYEEIARLVEDEEWSWEHAHQRFKKVIKVLAEC